MGVSGVKMNQKGDANMWWIIIGAVIALVVLIVLLVIFTSKSGKLETCILDCSSKGGECITEDKCVTTNSDGTITKGTIASAFDCQDKTTKCCFKSK